MSLRSNYYISHCLAHCRLVDIESYSKYKKEPANSRYQKEDIAEISAYAFIKMVKKDHNQVILMWLKDFEALNAIGPTHVKITADVAVISTNNYDKFFYKLRKKPLTLSKLRKLVPTQYHDYMDVWNSVEVNKLPLHRKMDYTVDIKANSVPPAKRAYGMSRD